MTLHFSGQLYNAFEVRRLNIISTAGRLLALLSICLVYSFTFFYDMPTKRAFVMASGEKIACGAIISWGL